MKVLCVGRHALLADHIASRFRDAGAVTHAAVGLLEGAELAADISPDVVLCDYDLLATNSLAPWERDPALGGIPVLAVSLTRRPEEACAFEVNGIAGFLYLPTLGDDAALQALRAVARRDAPAPDDADSFGWARGADPRAPARG